MFARRRSNIYFWLLETVTIITLVKMTAGSGEFCHLKLGSYAKQKSMPSIEFPPLMTVFTFFSIISTALLYDNHAKLIDGAFFPLRLFV